MSYYEGARVALLSLGPRVNVVDGFPISFVAGVEAWHGVMWAWSGGAKVDRWWQAILL